MATKPAIHTQQRVFRMTDEWYSLLRRIGAYYGADATGTLFILIRDKVTEIGTANLPLEPPRSPKARPGVVKATGKKSRKKSKKSG